MKIYFKAYYVIIFFISSQSFAQSNSALREFEIKGNCDISEGKVILSKTSKEEYYHYHLDKDTVLIKNHQFSIKGKISYPQMFRLIIPNHFTSNYFLVVPGIQSFDINSQEDWDVQIVDNSFKNEAQHYIEKFKKVYQTRQLIFKKEEELYKLKESEKIKKLDKHLDSLHFKNLERADKSLAEAIDEQNNSLYLLWVLDRYLNVFGYKTIYENAYNSFEPQIKSTQIGQWVKDKIFNLKTFGIGREFPIKEINQKKILNFKNKKYLLVDFWFSNCAPCLAEFPKLKEVHAEFRSKGFDIVGVSTDRTKDIENWKKVIKEKGLLWSQYLDENGIVAKKYNITYYPTNFLINEAGNIIMRNIKPLQLENFLKLELD